MPSPYSIENDKGYLARSLSFTGYAVIYDAPRVRAGVRNAFVVTDGLTYTEALDRLRELNGPRGFIVASQPPRNESAY